MAWRIQRRTVIIVALVTIFIIAALLAGFVAIARSIGARPGDVTTNYWAVYNEPLDEIPEEDRAWPALVEAAAPLLVARDRTTGPAFTFQPADNAESHRDALARVRAAAAKPHLGRPLTLGLDPYLAQQFFSDAPQVPPGPASQTPGADVPFNPTHSEVLSFFRNLARPLSADAAAARGEGDTARAVENTVALLRLARHAKEPSTIISELVGVAIASLAMNDALQLAATPIELGVTDEQLATLADEIAMTRAAIFDPAFTGEAAYIDDLLQRAFSRGGTFNARGLSMFTTISASQAGIPPPEPGPAWKTLAGAAALFMSKRPEVDAKLAEVREAVAAAMEAPAWEAEPMLAQLENLVRDVDSAPAFDVPMNLLSITIPPWTQVIRSSHQFDQETAATLTAIALARHRIRHGDWPATLEVIDPDLLAAPPVDHHAGLPLLYRPPETPAGIPTLYARGNDRDDDGGRHEPAAVRIRAELPVDGDLRFLPPP